MYCPIRGTGEIGILLCTLDCSHNCLAKYVAQVLNSLRVCCPPTYLEFPRCIYQRQFRVTYRQKAKTTCYPCPILRLLSNTKFIFSCFVTVNCQNHWPHFPPSHHHANTHLPFSTSPLSQFLACIVSTCLIGSTFPPRFSGE